MGSGVCVAEALSAATNEFASCSDTARLDAELLLTGILGRTRSWLYTWPDRELEPAEAERYRALVARRAAGEPVAYLLGHREFWSFDLKVTPATLIPRPDTEQLVEAALRRIPPEVSWAIADLGTGSGAIALALAAERPACRVVGVDLSAEAVAVARDNATALGLGNVEFRVGSWFGPLAPGSYQLIVSNPPYIAEGDPHLGQGDLRFEPITALAAGRDGLDAIRAIIAEAPAHLATGGWLLLEHGWDQAEAVRDLLSEAGFADLFTESDLAGQERVSGGRRDA